jgi:hypothetical protein
MSKLDFLYFPGFMLGEVMKNLLTISGQTDHSDSSCISCQLVNVLQSRIT